MDEITITRAITESYTRELLDFLEVDVAIAGAGPSGPVAAYYLAKKGRKTVIYERKRSAGGGMWGGGMMFNRIVVQAEAKEILDELGGNGQRIPERLIRGRFRGSGINLLQSGDKSRRAHGRYLWRHATLGKKGDGTGRQPAGLRK